ncbi:Polysialic acid transport protein KpsD precursor [Brevundimonas sp. SH203]|uniref:polysaccharide biosynthesis/export family protein n=1 Tax=Brevundimonas sp. SH203 TaxID=345167 RepID=UPI0009D37293|nr:polysaccharide biosynthesis/export family protein [Brevundimonas sp. SH203]GAW41410.1 Polysialic acid transport protein KpsD precursor [Brevundimonas sp. SH203]
MPRPVLAAVVGLALAFGLTAFSDPTLGDYRLAPADRVRIEVFGEPALGGDFTLDGRGRITLPLIGEIQASGLSAPRLQAAVADALAKGYLNQPRVAAQVLTYRPFYILGEVNRPGEYPYAADLTALQAVATAQGFTYRANSRRLFVRRAGVAVEQPLSPDARILPGDTVRIAERYF